MSDFRRNCIERELLIGTFAAIPHPVAIEVIAASGVDYISVGALTHSARAIDLSLELTHVGT